jgi:hypothetical protein
VEIVIIKTVISMKKGGIFVAAKPGFFMTDDKKKEDAELDVCTQAPEFAEHARPNEPGGKMPVMMEEQEPKARKKGGECHDRR